MNYAIITYGTRGDVQPYIALALGLLNNGYQVTLLAPANFKDLVEGYGVTFFPLHGDIEALLQTPESLRILKTGDVFALLKYMQKVQHQIQTQLNADILAGCRDADVLVSSVLTVHWVYAIAEKFNKKWAIVQLNPPTTPTKEFPFAGLAFFNSPRYNLFTYWLVRTVYWLLNKKDINTFRTSLGLAVQKEPAPEAMTKNILNIYAFSPQLISRPTDWDSCVIISGFLTVPPKNRELHEMDQLPCGLEAWLKNGEKPIYIGFGSVPVPDAQLLSAIIGQILAKANSRIILGTGWSAIPNLPDDPNLFVVKYVNHQWLLPQCKTAIIHGGVGTMAAVLKAKIPAIIISVIADQPWWGKIIEDNEAGVHIPFKKLTAERLIKAIELTETPLLRKNAFEIGDKINVEDGLRLSVDALENYFRQT